MDGAKKKKIRKRPRQIRAGEAEILAEGTQQRALDELAREGRIVSSACSTCGASILKARNCDHRFEDVVDAPGWQYCRRCESVREKA